MTAVAADPDRDRVSIVDLPNDEVIGHIALKAGDEPGRLVEDAAGRVHVALRGAGAIATIDVVKLKVSDRRSVCGAPRGIAYDAANDALRVACTEGELVTMPAAGGSVHASACTSRPTCATSSCKRTARRDGEPVQDRRRCSTSTADGRGAGARPSGRRTHLVRPVGVERC